MSNWYYAVCGIFLTNNSRDEYFDVQEHFQTILNNCKDENQELDKKTIYEIFYSGSKLRTKLAKEIGSRTNFRSLKR